MKTTPLVELVETEKKLNLRARIFAKLEMYNPSGSVKDRVALKMLEDARRSKKIKEGAVIIEPTSGNTGIGLAYYGKQMGYRTIIVMPSSMSAERIELIKSYGADVVLTPAEEGMAGSIAKAHYLASESSNSFIPNQFENPSNTAAHFETTGPEIYRQMDKMTDIFVAGIGTGGTITGVGRYLKQCNRNVVIAGVEPFSSPVLRTGISGSHKIQGIGANFVPKILDMSVIDEIADVTDDDAYKYTRMLYETEGIMCGISSGAALKAAVDIASKQENEGKRIAVLFPDDGKRYISTGVFG